MTTPSDRSETPRTDAGYRAHYAEHLNNIQLCRALERELATAQARVVELEEQIGSLKATFSLRWNADMRAIKRWQEAHPDRPHVWPDHADMCVWLLGQDDQLRAELTLAQQDTARLNKLQALALANGECWIQRVDKAGTMRLFWGQDELPIGIDLRAAIDAASVVQPKEVQ